MRIVGIGVDIIENKRIKNSLKNLKFNSSTSIMGSDQNDYSSDLIYSNNNIQLDHNIGWAEIT